MFADYGRFSAKSLAGAGAFFGTVSPSSRNRCRRLLRLVSVRPLGTARFRAIWRCAREGREEEEDSARMERGSSGDLRWVDNRPQSSSHRARVTSFPRPCSLADRTGLIAQIASLALTPPLSTLVAGFERTGSRPRHRRRVVVTALASSSRSASLGARARACDKIRHCSVSVRQAGRQAPNERTNEYTTHARHARTHAAIRRRGTAIRAIPATTTHARSYYALTRPRQ